METFALVALVLPLYVLPSIAGFWRRYPARWAILGTNLFLPGLLIAFLGIGGPLVGTSGLIAALTWCLMEERARRKQMPAQIATEK